MRARMKNKEGFSISEMLMVVMILSLIIVILGSGVMVVKNAYERITLKAEAQTLLSTTITKVTDEFRFSKYINDDGTSPAKFTSGIRGYEIWFEDGDGTSGKKGNFSLQSRRNFYATADRQDHDQQIDADDYISIR